MSAHDIIPDIHADPQRLEATLATLGKGAPPAFLGDFIDGGGGRGDDRAVLTRVRGLIEAGDALAVMGNHELNAILFHRRDVDGRPLRPHLDKNIRQHRSFLNQFGVATPEALEWTGWFMRALPLWRDLGGLRLVHACWNDEAVATIARRRPDGFLQDEDLPEIADPGTAFGAAVKLLTSGPETPLPPSSKPFHDNSGHPRHDVRLAWWRSSARTWAMPRFRSPIPANCRMARCPRMSRPGSIRPKRHPSLSATTRRGVRPG